MKGKKDEKTHNREENELKSLQRYREFNHKIEIKSREKCIPINGCFELTPYCNLDCKMCYVHLLNTQYCEKLINVEKWQNLMKEAHEFGMISAFLTGGECLLYPDFDEIFLYLKHLGVRTGIMSNGLLFDEKRLDFFMKNKPKLIQVSVYGSSDDAYEKVTGKRVFSTIKNNLLNIKQAELPLIISITPNGYMVDDIYPLIDFVESLEIPYNINSKLITPRKDTEREKKDFSLEQYVEIYKARSSANNIVFSPIDYAELPEESHCGETKKGFMCGAGRSSFTIKYDGKMIPCSSFEELHADPFEVGFEQAWREINNKVKDYLVPCECASCIYKDVCLLCAAAHKDAKSGHCDKSICERTKYLVSQGVISIPK